MCRVPQVLKVFLEIKVLQVPLDLLAYPNLAHQDPVVPLEPKDLQVGLDFPVMLDQTVKVLFQDLKESLAILDQMENQGVLVTSDFRVETLQYSEMRGTMGTRDARVLKV